MKRHLLGTACLALGATPAFAGAPVKVSDNITITPIVEARARYEMADVATPGLTDANAITVRWRAGAEVSLYKRLSVLVEGESTLAVSTNYNSTTNGKTGYATVADPETVELNRAQVQYKSKMLTLTAGRQRINLDDQRFVGSVAWRQNEQTFDAVRAEAKVGPIAVDATYAWSQHTIFGVNAGARRDFDGKYWFVQAGATLGNLKLKGFTYLLNYDGGQPVSANSTQTYGLRATGAFKLAPKLTLNMLASYAIQADYKANPSDFVVNYLALEAGLASGNYAITGGYELLGADQAKGKAFQTPFATLHKFNGWADLFLTTPANGLQDYYVNATAKFPQVKFLPGLNATVAWHYFKSDVGGQKYGKEWDAQIGFKVAKKINMLAKYADYDRIGISKFTGDVNTRRFWLQAEFSL